MHARVSCLVLDIYCKREENITVALIHINILRKSHMIRYGGKGVTPRDDSTKNT